MDEVVVVTRENFNQSRGEENVESKVVESWGRAERLCFERECRSRGSCECSL